MSCQRYQMELEDLLYGELDEARAAELRRHLIACAACAAVRDELAREQELFTQFYEQNALDPSAALWDAIRARIEPSELTSKAQPENRLQALLGFESWAWLLRPAVLRQAAFALVLIALTVAATMFFLKRGDERSRDIARDKETVTTPTPQADAPILPQPAPPNDIAQTPSPTVAPKPKQAAPRVARPLSDEELMNQQIARAAREYQKAIKLLNHAIAKRRGSLDPNLFKQYEASLALIDHSIAASRRALRERPDDLATGQFLLAAYAKKVELMQDLAMK